MTTILIVDPGGTTGIAQLTVEGKPELVMWGQVPDGTQGMIEELNGWERTLPDRVVYEDFVFRRTPENLGADLTPLSVLGALRYWTTIHTIPMTKQQPGMHETVDIEVVERLGLLIPNYKSKHVHAMDAIRHGILYLLYKRNEYVMEAWNG